MESLELKVYESAAVPAGEAAFVFRADDPRLPAGLRGGIGVPCVVTSDFALFDGALTLLHIAELWGDAAPAELWGDSACAHLSRFGGGNR